MKKLLLISQMVLLTLLTNAQVSYISYNDTATLIRLLKKQNWPVPVKDNKAYYIKAVNNDTTVEYNYFWNPGGYISLDVPLSDSGMNVFDARILGTWINSHNMIISITQSGAFLRYKQYDYRQDKKTYQGGMGRLLRITNVDSTNFIEYNWSEDPITHVSKRPMFVPCKYELIDNNHLLISQISIKYAFNNLDSLLKISEFTKRHGSYGYFKKYNSTEEYREYVMSYIDNPDFFMEGSHFARVTDKYTLTESKYAANISEKSAKDAIILGGMLLIAGSLFLSEGSNSGTYQSQPFQQEPITGYTKSGEPLFGGARYSVSGDKEYYDAKGQPK